MSSLGLNSILPSRVYLTDIHLARWSVMLCDHLGCCCVCFEGQVCKTNCDLSAEIHFKKCPMRVYI